MTVGCFIGPVSTSYVDEAQDDAAAFVGRIDKALKRIGLAGYEEPDAAPDVYTDGLFGRSALDHHSGSCLARLAELGPGGSAAPHLHLIAVNPYRVTYLPAEFEEPLPTGHCDTIWGEQVEIWVGSLPRLHAELTALAPLLGIPLNGPLSNEVAERINDCQPLYDDDDCSTAEDGRSAWLLLYEGTRMALQHGVPMTLAG